jgi:hypothetical protein
MADILGPAGVDNIYQNGANPSGGGAASYSNNPTNNHEPGIGRAASEEDNIFSNRDSAFNKNTLQMN